jgi:CheY-like chemotaxis protein
MSTNFSSGKTILLVEDEALISMAEAQLLRDNGYSVVTARSGSEAISALNEHQVDLILMDVDLGENEMTGPEAAETILRDRHVPIVFLSSHTEPEIVQKTEAIASYGYVVKNSGEQVLLASIRMAFRLADANAALMQEKATEAVRTNVLLELHENHSHAPEKLYDYILGASLALTGSKHSFFGLLDDEESEMVIHAWSKEAAADCAVRGEPIHFPVSRAGIWGDCVRRREPVIYNDYNADIPSKRGVPAGHVPIRRFLGFPVFEGEKIVAVGGGSEQERPLRPDRCRVSAVVVRPGVGACYPESGRSAAS